MFNLLKADIYRLFKTKSYYIVGILLGLFITMVMYSLGEMPEHGVNPSNLQFIDLVYNSFMGTFIIMIIGIEGAVYICTDYSSGYIKNIASSVNRKSSIAISKFIAYAIGVALYMVFILIVAYIFGNVFIGNVVIGDIGKIASYLGMVYFLMLVMMGVVVLSSSLFRNNAASITTLVLVILVSGFLYTSLNQFLGIDLTEFSPIINYQMLTPDNTNTWLTTILSGLGFLGVYLVGSAILMEKKDIT